jgi:hypothetical protein
MLPKVSLRYGRYAAEYAGVNRVAKLIMMKSEDDMENVRRKDSRHGWHWSSP